MGAREGDGQALPGSGLAGPAALRAGQPAPLAPLGRFYSVSKGQKIFHNARSDPDRTVSSVHGVRASWAVFVGARSPAE